MLFCSKVHRVNEGKQEFQISGNFTLKGNLSLPTLFGCMERLEKQGVSKMLGFFTSKK
jgi:hypothetical protein